MESGELSVIEETESTIGMGIRAALQGVGFMTARALIGTDLLKVRRDIATITCPYTNEEYPAIPPWRPKVAIIHTEMSDTQGNSIVSGNRCIDAEIAQLADLTIVTTEKIVESHELPPGETYIIGKMVDVVVEAPCGSWPTSCYPKYGLDAKWFIDYIESVESNTSKTFIEELMSESYQKEELTENL